MAAQDARSDGADASLALKNEGNAALARGRYAEAISCYSRALEADPSSPVLYSNRAMAHIKAESYGLAIADAEASIRLDASYIKAYYRRGSANFALGKYKLALRDFRAVCKLRPNDRDARLKLKECERAAEQRALGLLAHDDGAAVPAHRERRVRLAVRELADGDAVPVGGRADDGNVLR